MYLGLFIIICFASTEFYNNKLTIELKNQLMELPEDATIGAIIIMKQDYPYDKIINLPLQQRVRVIENIARTSQKSIIQYLKNFPEHVDSIIQFWIFNGIYILAKTELINRLVSLDDILLISHIPEVKSAPIICDGNFELLIPEWNIQKIMADSCWVAGYTGDSVILGIVDAGIDTTHPALRGGKLIRWRDFVNNIPYPYDDDVGRGTSIAGVICGGDGLGLFPDDIGVAPDAKLVVAKVTGGVIPVNPIVALEWMAVLKADSGLNIRAINNAWGTSNQFDLSFWNICNTLKSLEILPVFAIGNGGPGQSTTNTPGNYPLVLSAGATNSNDSVILFSSRGPAPDSFPWNDTTYWYRNDWSRIKPDLTAPGYLIRTSRSNHQYTTVSGTAYSCAHTTGAVAILFEKNPNLTITQVYNTLLNNADTPSYGAPYPNNNYGWGRLNIWKALQSLTGIRDSEKNTSVNTISLKIYPNPFRNKLDIRYLILDTGLENHTITLAIYDVSGCVVKSFNPASSIQNQASSIVWFGEDDTGRKLPAGVYFVHLDAGNYKRIEKVIFLR